MVTGDALCARSRGFWRHQFGEKGKRQIDEDTLNGYLEIVDFVSAYFQERVSLGTFEEVEAVLEARGPGKRGKAEAQVLAAWLNFAHGAVGWEEEILFEEDDEDEVASMPFYQVMAETEAVLLDPEATGRGVGVGRACPSQPTADDACFAGLYCPTRNETKGPEIK